MWEITEVLLCWSAHGAGDLCEHKADEHFCSQEWPTPLSPHLPEDFQWGELSFKVHILKQKPPPTLKPSSFTAFSLLFGFSACFFPLVLLRAERIHVPVLPPSLWPRRRLKNPHKVLKKFYCFCAIKRLQQEQITFFLGAHHTPPLATSSAAACSASFPYKK